MIYRVLSVLGLSVLLSSCGGGGGGGPLLPVVNDITVGQLSFGKTLPITLAGINLNQDDDSVVVQVSGCQGLAQSSAVTAEAVQLTCVPTTVGPLTVTALSQTGEVLASRQFTVPAPQVTFDTNLGTIVAELKPQEAFATVVNFLIYVQSGAYNNVIFHRVQADFVAQTGAVTADEIPVPPRTAIALESNNGLSNLKGTLGMARLDSPLDSATSSFYFNLADNLNLDYVSEERPGYAVFGEIVSGLAVLEAIGNVPVQNIGGNLTHFPITPIIINTAIQTQ